MISSGFFWGFVSDVMGRQKPLYLGLLADGIASFCLSCSQSFEYLVRFSSLRLLEGFFFRASAFMKIIDWSVQAFCSTAQMTMTEGGSTQSVKWFRRYGVTLIRKKQINENTFRYLDVIYTLFCISISYLFIYPLNFAFIFPHRFCSSSWPGLQSAAHSLSPTPICLNSLINRGEIQLS